MSKASPIVHNFTDNDYHFIQIVSQKFSFSFQAREIEMDDYTLLLYKWIVWLIITNDCTQ